MPLRHLPAVDAVGVFDNVASGRLAEDRLQAHHGGRARFDDVLEYAARTDAGQLIHVAHEQQMRAGRYGLEQMVHQQQIKHGRFIHDQNVHIERVLLVDLKGDAVRGLEFEQAVDRFGRAAGGFTQAFGRTAGRRGQRVGVAGGFQQADDRLHGEGLACARSAGQYGQRLRQRGLDGFTLRGREGQTSLALHCGKRGAPVELLKERQAVALPVAQAAQTAGHANLTAIERHQVDRALLGHLHGRRVIAWAGDLVEERFRFRGRHLRRGQNALDMHLVFLTQLLDGVDHEGGRHAQHVGCLRDEGCLRHVDMAVIRLLAENVRYASRDPFWRIKGQPQGARDLVRGDEADSVNVARQAVRIILDDPYRAVAIVLVNFDRQAGGDAVLLQEEHHIANGALLAPGVLNQDRTLGANAKHGAQTFWLFVNHLQAFGAKLAHDALGGDRPDALDQPRTQVLFDPGGRGRQLQLEGVCFELAPILGMRSPLPAQFDVFADVDAQHAAHDRHGVAFALWRQLRHRIAVLFILIGNAFDRAGQRVHLG